jgi:hypothetical protein
MSLRIAKAKANWRILKILIVKIVRNRKVED